jgi:sulfur relay (sulfurtransferase) complex TusBCD TusD component (DsrE family)
MNLKKWVQITKKEPIELPMCDNVVKARCLTEDIINEKIGIIQKLVQYELEVESND